MSIQVYKSGDPEVVLQSDLAAEFPIYVYLNHEANEVLYTKSLRTLLDDMRVRKPLAVSEEGISFLLQSSVVPPPRTIFKQLFVLSVGDRLRLYTNDQKLRFEFSYEFPFSNVTRLPFGTIEPDEDRILEMLAQATVSRLDSTRDSYMFHSAGKDSNMVALALAEAGWQKKITLLSHQSQGAKDESAISKSIGDKLGFRHECLSEDFSHISLEELSYYFTNVTFPAVDVVTLAYPFYSMRQCRGLKHANVIDGGGNDIYMGVLPSRRDALMFPLNCILAPLRTRLDKYFDSESFFTPLTRTKSEWCGFGGFLFSEAKRIFPDCLDVRPYFQIQDQQWTGRDEVDFKTRYLVGVVAEEMHIRKFRTATDVWESNPILPFANAEIATYLSKLPEQYLFSRSQRKNKVVFRKILKERLQLDSDKLGKLGYSFDFWSFLKKIKDEVYSQIFKCAWWSHSNVADVLQRLWACASKPTSARVRRARTLILRLYLISAWANHNRYLKP